MAEPDTSRVEPHDLLVMLGHTTVVLVLLTAGYYLLPMRRPWPEPVNVARTALTAAAAAGLVWAFRFQARRSRTQPDKYLRIQWLLSALYVLVLGYALAYSVLDRLDPAQFAGIADRTDALYFSVTVLGTVGFGDVHATATVSRILVTTQMLVNLIYIGTALRLLSSMRDRSD
jgi:hypothetical protein